MSNNPALHGSTARDASAEASRGTGDRGPVTPTGGTPDDKSVTLSVISLDEFEADMRCSWCGGQGGYRIARDGRELLSCSTHIGVTAERVWGDHS